MIVERMKDAENATLGEFHTNDWGVDGEGDLFLVVSDLDKDSRQVVYFMHDEDLLLVSMPVDTIAKRTNAKVVEIHLEVK